MFIKIWPLIFSFALANAAEVLSASPYESMPSKKERKIKSTFVDVGLNISQNKINHQETSSTSGFFALNEVSKLKVIGLDLDLMKEFFQDQLFSFSVFGRGSLAVGTAHELTSTGNEYREKLTGINYGTGLSLNSNFSAYKLKIQPYLAYSLSKGNSRYKLNYGPINASEPIKINYTSKDSDSTATLGARFFDSRVELLSFFAVNYLVSSKNERTIDGSYGNAKLTDLSNLSSVERSSLSFAVGFGFFY